MHIVGSVKHERNSLTACGKVATSARCCPPGPSRCFATWMMVSWALFILLLCHFCAPFCSRNCLLDVSRLLGLTLRHSACVCSCHRDSSTRWRLALAQEAACVVSSMFSRLFFCSPVCLVISDNLRGRSLQAVRTYEACFARKFVFHTFPFFASLTVLDHIIVIRLEALEMCYILVL